ncbi:MAG: putative esterase, partial [Acidimicrobiales bacterium]|nr:putative esterase [Acidimicrobiales bacterium]
MYRPGGLADTSKMPVVYMLHGLPGDPAALWTQHGEAAALDTQFARGAFPYVVVTVDGRGTKHNDTEWGDSIDGTDRVESFILNVAMPAV